MEKHVSKDIAKKDKWNNVWKEGTGAGKPLVMNTVSFFAKISKQGPAKVIFVPKALEVEIQKFEGKKLLVVLEDLKKVDDK
ncbi:MAG: hypothetical protein ACP5MZ_03245 [Candidatus Micrarchaeia archaeon]